MPWDADAPTKISAPGPAALERVPPEEHEEATDDRSNASVALAARTRGGTLGKKTQQRLCRSQQRLREQKESNCEKVVSSVMRAFTQSTATFQLGVL